MSPNTITLSNELSELSRMVVWIDAFCARVKASAADSSALHLALEEIVTNIITHGFVDGAPHVFTVSLEALSPDRVKACVVDDAIAFNPLARPVVNTSLPLEERPIGGLGVHLVRSLMDVCVYERRDGQNHFSMERQLHRSAAGSARVAMSKLDASVEVALAGRLDGLSSPELERQVMALMQSGIHVLAFDLAALDYVSSAGLRVFILAARKMKANGGHVRFVALTPSVKEVFHLSGLLTVLDIA